MWNKLAPFATSPGPGSSKYTKKSNSSTVQIRRLKSLSCKSARGGESTLENAGSGCYSCEARLRAHNPNIMKAGPGEQRLVECLQPIIDIFAREVPRAGITLLNFAFELVATSVDFIDFVVRQISPIFP
jgi:hypothetical protein